MCIRDSYGRPDAEKVGRGISRRKTPKELVNGMDLKKPVIVLDHEPRQLEELNQAGVDIDLCGHTHDGQLLDVYKRQGADRMGKSRNSQRFTSSCHECSRSSRDAT